MRLNTKSDKRDTARQEELLFGDRLKKEKQDQIKTKFIQSTNLKNVYSKLNHEIDLAQKAYDDNLEIRRNQLKAKLLEDETCLTFEYVEKAQKYAEKLYELKKKKAEAILEAYEKDRLDYVNDVYTKLKILNCDELRLKTQRHRRKMLVGAHEYQILEKKQLLAKEKEIDSMYHNIVDTLDVYNFENANKRRIVTDRAKIEEVLKKQITAKELTHAELEAIKEEEKENRLKTLRNMEKEEQINLERQQKNKELLRKTILDQIELKQKVGEQRKQYEAEMDKIILEDLQREMRENLETNLEDKKKLAGELAEYSKVWKELNKFKEELDLKDEQTITDVNYHEVEKIKDFRREMKHIRLNTAKEMAATWDQQVLGKKLQIKEEKEIEEAERKLYEMCNADIDKATRRQKCLDAVQLQNDQMAQMNYKQMVAKREKEDRLKMENDLLESNEAKLVECVNLDFKFDQMEHPFYKALFPCK